MYKRFFKDVKEYAYLCRYMARTGLKAEVANSYLNWVWWVLEPIASMLIYYVIFSNVLGRGQQYYVAFIYTGTLIWSYFERCMTFAVQAVRLNRDIVTRTYIPKPVLILSNMLFNSIKMMISVVLLFIVLIIQQVPFTPYILLAVPVIIVMQLITFGCGLILMHFGVFVDDLAHAMRIALRVLFYVSGIFYELKKLLPAPWGMLITRVNPFAAVIYNTRNALIYATAPEALTMIIWFVLGVILCTIGLNLCYKYENTYVKVI